MLDILRVRIVRIDPSAFRIAVGHLVLCIVLNQKQDLPCVRRKRRRNGKHSDMTKPP